MEISERMKSKEFSPIRKFYPYQVEAEKRGIKIYNFNIGQPDIETPKGFMERIKGYKGEVLEYLPSQGLPELLEKIKAYYKKHGMDYETRDILITNGGSEGLMAVFSSIFNEGDEVIIPEPFYTNYKIFLSYFGAKIVPIKSHAEEGYHYGDREKIEKLITGKTKAILVNSPSNPTGNVLTKEEMELILEIGREHSLYVISDEVYREFVYDDAKVSSFGVSQKGYEDNLIIIDSISKRFSACGARIGMVITKNEAVKEAVMHMLQARLSAPALEQVGACFLYELPDEYYEEVRKTYEKRRDIAYSEIIKIPDVICKKPRGSFYITIKLPVKDAEAFQMFMLKDFDYNKETIMFAPCKGFYETKGRGLREIRIAYVLNEESIKKGMEILRRGLLAYKERKEV